MERSSATLPFGRHSADSRRATLLTCYMTGATEGKNLGIAGYSHDFVARLFGQMLERWGKVIPVPKPEENLEAAIRDARAQGLDPVHLSVLPFQDVCLARTAPNIVMPAWEFPDVPNYGFNDNPQNNWPATADRCDLVLVSGPFTEQALRKGNAKVPIRTVQVPTPDGYFLLPDWEPNQTKRVDCPAYVFPQPKAPLNAKLLLSQGYEFVASNLAAAGRRKRKPQLMPRYAGTSPLELSGVVYTSVFNPADGRKNWRDMLTGFLYALGDREDATLVLKLITKNARAVRKVVDYYRHRDIPHRCKVVVICDFLSEDQMCKLAEASTYYLQTTKAEGNCLPLMNFLAAGRPGISPDHSAMSDYFDESVGFVIESHPEPAAWPHQKRMPLRSTWGRLVWPSIVEQIRRSYHLAKDRPEQYAAMADRCRTKMHAWAGFEPVWQRLHSALEELVNGQLRRDDARAAVGSAAPLRRAA
ncbi:MAG: glycosyltransferase [Planctomycetales bacterium]|nr:glycosyltransferase [Planctomycetales bacterium]MBN8627829.1 glycosyltransferase [Planctomycetota bacterium]